MTINSMKFNKYLGQVLFLFLEGEEGGELYSKPEID